MSKSIKTRLDRLIGISGSDWALLASAVPLILYIRLGLTFSKLHRLQQRLLGGDGQTMPQQVVDPARVAWCVRNAARLVPQATCLTQALAYQVLLHRRGIASSIKLGVRRVGHGGLAAHAWVVVDGKVALGGTEAALARFSGIAEFGPSPQ